MNTFQATQPTTQRITRLAREVVVGAHQIDGKLTVVEITTKEISGGRGKARRHVPAVVCRCDCGSAKRVTLTRSEFAGGRNRSCGCLVVELLKERGHGDGFDSSAPIRGYAPWHPQHKTQALIADVKEILSSQADYLPLTVRQIYYMLVGSYGYSKTAKFYSSLIDALKRARRAEMIPFEEIRDDSIAAARYLTHRGVGDFWRQTGRRIDQYERDRQAGQEQYVELWCEATWHGPATREGGVAVLCAHLFSVRVLIRDREL